MTTTTSRATTLTALACAMVLGLTAACTPNPPVTKLRVLASSELVDMRPLLDELRRDTGIELVLDHEGTLDATHALTPGNYQHDFAWLSSDRYFELRLKASTQTGTRPLATEIMSSPVVVGVRPETAKLLRRNAADRTSPAQVSWADIADAAAAGQIRFGMADPSRSNSGLAALVGVATAAAGTGGALRPQDVACDRLRGFFAGQTLTASTSNQLVDAFVAGQPGADALISYESVLMSLNANGRLREPLEIIYPQDGIVLAQYPLLLLNSARRPEYDRVVTWLTGEGTQKKIMERTHRRPIDPDIPREARLQAGIGNALYFPDQPEVIDKLLANYHSDSRVPGQVIFLLDYSGSMRGRRMSELRSTFAGLGGADNTSTGSFLRFYRGEKFTLIRFGGTVLAERTFTIGGQPELDAMRDFLAIDQFDGHTAIWSALDHAYQRASSLVAADARQPVTIVLMTDGANNTGIGLDEFVRRYHARPPGVRAVHTYTIRYGEADPAELDSVARATGGRMMDAVATSLDQAIKETRGCR